MMAMADANMPSHMKPHKRWLNILEWTAIGITGAVILAPYLSSVGIGSADDVAKAINAIHAGTGTGEGLAGLIAEGLGKIPLVGPTLAAGGWQTAAAAGTIGIGGTLLGNVMAARATTPRGVHWCEAISYAALATSMLISMPALLTGVSVGLVYLTRVLSGAELSSWAATQLSDTLGSVNTITPGNAGAVGALTTVARLLTCCMPMIPTGFALAMHKLHGAKKDATIGMQVALDLPLTAGQPATGTLRLTEHGRTLSNEQLAMRHGHKLHLMVVDDALNDYHHLHPQPTNRPGVFTFAFTPHAGGRYHFWTDAEQSVNGQPVNVHQVVDSSPLSSRMAPVASVQPAAGGMQFRWSATPPLRQGEDSIVTVRVSDASGKAAGDLQPVMGAPAHLVGFSAGAATMLHLHPLDSEAKDGVLRFHLRPEASGKCRFFLQVARQDKTFAIPFTQEVFPSRRQPARSAPHASHASRLAEAPAASQARA